MGESLDERLSIHVTLAASTGTPIWSFAISPIQSILHGFGDRRQPLDGPFSMVQGNDVPVIIGPAGIVDILP